MDPNRLTKLDLQRDPKGSAEVILKAFDANAAHLGNTAKSFGVRLETLSRWIGLLTGIEAKLDAIRAKHADEIAARRSAIGRQGGLLGGRPRVEPKKRTPDVRTPEKHAVRSGRDR